MRIWNHIAGEPWAITETALHTILEIAARENESPQAVAAKLGRNLQNTYMGLVDLERNNFTVKISSSARAMLECLYLAPKHQEFFECYELMEGMNNLRPKSVQELLENCSSIKVKRLFLYLADKFKHPWLDFVDLSNVGLGSGKRSLVKNGVYIDKYKITVPKEFEKNEQPNV